MSTSARPPAESRRGITLESIAASAWLESRDIVVREGSRLRLVADEISAPGFVASRIWHTAIEAEVRPSSDSSRLLLQIEGDMTLRIPGDGLVGPGEMVLLPRRQSMVFSTTEPTARIEIQARMKGRILDLADPVIIRRRASEFHAPFVSLVHSILNSNISAGQVGFSSVQTAVSHLAFALIEDSLSRRETLRPGGSVKRQTMVVRAREEIRANAVDPTFTIAILAGICGVSERRMRAVFASAGTHPLHELRRARVSLAEGYFRARRDGQRMSVEEIAHASGFSSARAMRRAFSALGLDPGADSIDTVEYPYLAAE